MTIKRNIVTSVSLLFVVICPVMYCENPQTVAATVEKIMGAALDRCYFSADGIRRISFQNPTDTELSDVQAIGKDAVAPIATYLDKKIKDGFTQLIAVKLLIALNDPSTLQPLIRALGKDQWEVTRAQALSGLYTLSPKDAKPYVEALLKDDSALVRQRARDLWNLYPGS